MPQQPQLEDCDVARNRNEEASLEKGTRLLDANPNMSGLGPVRYPAKANGV